MDLNHRRLKSTDLQSVAIDRSATPPLIPYRVEDLVNSFYFLELIAFCSDCQPFFYLFLNLFVLSCWTAEIFFAYIFDDTGVLCQILWL